MKKRIPVILLVLVLLALVMVNLVFTPVTGLLPRGQWYQFRGGPGSAAAGPVNVMAAGDPEGYHFPWGITYLSPKNLKKALSGRRVLPVGASGAEGSGTYFVFRFFDSRNRQRELWFWKDGTIAFSCDGRDTKVYRDNGGCYAALKEAFGDMDDIESWKIQDKEEQG